MPGDRVAVLMDNAHRPIEAFATAMKAGFTHVPLNSRLTAAELVRDSGAVALHLQEFLAGRLTSFKRPRIMGVLAELPKNSVGKIAQGPAMRAVPAGRGPTGLSLGRSQGHRGYLRMFTARATTSTATTSEIASCAIIMSLAQGRIAETSVGLNAVPAVNARCR